MARLFVRFLCTFAFVAATTHCGAAGRVVFTRLGPTQSVPFIANADGSAERPLTQRDSLNYNPAWSPHDDWIAFTSERAGPANLFRMHRDGSDVQRLTDDPAYDDQAAFSPDAGQIVFVSTRSSGFANLWILDVARRKARPLTTGPGWRFQACVVPRRPVDRLLFRPRQRSSHREKPLGTASSGRHLSHSSRRLGAQTRLAAWELLRQSAVDGGQQKRSDLLHAGARYLDVSNQVAYAV